MPFGMASPYSCFGAKVSFIKGTKKYCTGLRGICTLQAFKLYSPVQFYFLCRILLYYFVGLICNCINLTKYTLPVMKNILLNLVGFLSCFLNISRINVLLFSKLKPHSLSGCP